MDGPPTGSYGNRCLLSYCPLNDPSGFDQPGGRHLGVGVLGDARDLFPGQPAVEAKPEPAAVPDVRRDEEPLGIGLHEHSLHAGGGGAPDREAPVAVVVGQHHQECALAANEERRRAVTEPLARLGQPEAELAQPCEDLFSLLFGDYGRSLTLTWMMHSSAPSLAESAAPSSVLGCERSVQTAWRTALIRWT